MRIGVISDTHIPEAGADIPARAYEVLEGCELILHCGDMHSLLVLDRLERIAPVLAARGNGDTYHPMPNRPGVPEDPRVCDAAVYELAGYRVGLTHDLEEANGRSEELAEALVRRVFGELVDIAVCGHTHVPLAWRLSSGLTILNPGSPTLPYGYTHVVGTVGLLELSADGYEYRVINLDSGEIEITLEPFAKATLVQGPRPKWPGVRR